VTTPSRVTVVEVGPRDGLQNEHVLLPAVEKAAYVDLLSAAGMPVIEVAAFVSPKRVPQMADADEVLARITPRPGVRYSALVPNMLGLERARAAGVQEIAVFAAASETFSERNINQRIDASLAGYAQVCAAAHTAGIRVRGYLSTSFGCPYEGDIPVARVLEISRQLLDFGVFEASISDTIGVAHPGQLRRTLDALLPRIPVSQVALHFHDTRGTALANVLAALEYGVATFDASAGGLGGCPFAPGAAGNLATEDLLYMLHGLDIETGASLEGVLAASTFMESRLDHPLPSRVYRAARATRLRST